MDADKKLEVEEPKKTPQDTFNDMNLWLDELPVDKVISFSYKGSQVTVFKDKDTVVFQQGPFEIKVLMEKVKAFMMETPRGDREVPAYRRISIIQGTSPLQSLDDNHGGYYLKDTIDSSYSTLLRSLMSVYDADSNKSEVQGVLIEAIRKIKKEEVEEATRLRERTNRRGGAH